MTAPIDRKRYASFFDVVECKGRLGPRYSRRERFAIFLGKLIASAVMRDQDLRRELVISIAIDLPKYQRDEAEARASIAAKELARRESDWS